MASGADLTRLEMKVLAILKSGPLLLDELCKRVAADAELAKLTMERLEKKGLITIVEEKSGIAKITEAGVAAAEEGLPERRLVSMLVASGGKVAFDAAARSLGRKFGTALSRAFKNRWVTVAYQGGLKYIVFTGAVEKSARELMLERLAREGELQLSELGVEELKTLSELEKEGYVTVEGGRKVLVRLTEKGEEEAAQLPPLEAQLVRGVVLKKALLAALAGLLALLAILLLARLL